MRLDHWRGFLRLIQTELRVVTGSMQAATVGTWSSSLHSWGYPHRSVRHGAGMRGNDKSAMGQDPAAWITAIAARQDRAAFAALFEFYAPRIKALLMRMGTSAEIGEDIAQETLLAAWRKASYFDPARASASAWIYSIARNLRIDRLRNDNRAKLYASLAMAEIEEPERPDAIISAAERAERVRDALGQIPQEQVRVLQLSFFEGRAHGDIAEKLNLPLGTVKSRVRLAMSRLRHLLGDLS
jgi:RNA polymerase sigma-70 factor (ECF subfamily)